jgi:hypothetical protein
MDRRALMLGLAVAAAPAMALPGLAWADSKPPIKLSKVFGFLDKYLAIPPADRNRFTLAYTFMVDGKPAGGLKAAIVEPDGRRTPLAFAPDGRALRLPNAAQLASASFAADVPPATKLGVRLSLEPLITPAQELPARDLELSLAQANAGMAKAGGLIAFALPKLTAVSFPGAGSGRARLANGAEIPLPVDEGAPFYDPKALKGAATILLAHVPARLAFKDK